MRTLEDLYKDFGGPSQIGQAIGVATEHAAAMKRRGSIPVRYWSALLKAAKTRGIAISPDVLLRVHDRERAA